MVTIQAENMSLSGYSVDGADPDWIKVMQSQGTAISSFSGASDTYTVVVGAVAENDGQSTLELWIGGSLVGSFTYPLASASREPFTHNFGTSAISPGDEIRIVGYRDDSGSGTAHARVDYITFTP